MSVLIPTDFRHGWAIFGPLADKNICKGVLLELPASEKFSGLLCTCCEISVWNFAYTSSGWCHTSVYTPVWKMGRIMPWQCPSVRPRFPDFTSTCFEISIWNLVYTFSRWHDMSSLSCIAIGSFWPSLQPKVGQTHFLQSWPHESR